jgi:hypothetical protein
MGVVRVSYGFRRGKVAVVDWVESAAHHSQSFAVFKEVFIGFHAAYGKIIIVINQGFYGISA